MSFNSTIFVFFFLVVFFGYWAIARTKRLRFAFLFAASCVFYMSWNAKFLALILFSTVLDYYVGNAIHRSSDDRRRKLLLGVSLVGNLGLLGFFKYFNFFLDNFHASLTRFGLSEATEFVPWNIVLPVGISFYTFQTLSYTIDIYRRQLEPTGSLLKFGLFVSFFPQLVAGPIVRAKDFLPQLEAPAAYEEGRAAKGLFLILLGMIKKVVLADTIGAQLVDPVYADPGSYGILGILLGVYGALFQFYLDFSAYSDIAIGCAACLGFRLRLNFDRPFLSQDLNEFWRRWHISMTSWFRDYVFISLGGTRTTRGRLLRNLLVTMILTGLWHGAGWNYVIWGGMYGVAMCVNVFLPSASDEQKARRGLSGRLVRRVATFNFVALSMLFFRNGTLMEGNRGLAGSLDMLSAMASLGVGTAALETLGVVALAAAALIHFTPKDWVHAAEGTWLKLPSPVQAAGLVFVTGALAAMAARPFIYFQF